MDEIECVRCLGEASNIVSFLQLCASRRIKNGCEAYCKIKMFLELDDEDRLEIVNAINIKLLSRKVV